MNEQAKKSTYKYAYWRTDKAKEPGYSHELIGHKVERVLDQTNLDELNAPPFPGIDTVYKAMMRNVELYPEADVLGTRVGNEY